ncbi:hypothetical protein bplSymb_SCF03804P005 [Bathymodiolus platifrons methanotrophic gill symbiont]|uniref:hypothetical protein n=1 Tax=Bathymodiolus platifrons methanotrophic gill symbiont TaxID=113268 RepID=UPI000B40EB6E|nr:hypothetical protein [Bathymodiolus platifrons methanotrophic gill symbiont]GAW86765.1 hypothetical protein bplSymb_SCF03804P005 [Bathymodiolus platifrons methanotrophic gill symbiont]
MKTKLMVAASLMTLFNTAGQAGQEIGVGVQNPTHQVGRGGFGVPRDPRPIPGDTDLFERELERRAEAARKVEEERRAHEARAAEEAARKADESGSEDYNVTVGDWENFNPLTAGGDVVVLDITEERKEEERQAQEARAEAERARLAEIARIEAEKREARANDIYPEIYVTNAEMFSLYDDDHRTYSFYPEISGWHIFETYGNTDSVMEIYHNGESIVNEGESDGDRGIDDNELQHKYLEAGERYVVQVYLEYWTVRGTVILNVRAEDTPEELYNPLKLGYAKKFWLAPNRSHFTTKFTPKETGWYNIESFSDDEDTVMEIYNPAGHSIVAVGESDGDRGVGDEELQVKKLEAGKTYTIQVYLQDLDDEGFAWVHVWRIS